MIKLHDLWKNSTISIYTKLSTKNLNGIYRLESLDRHNINVHWKGFLMYKKQENLLVAENPERERDR